MHPKLVEGTITYYCGALKGTIVGGLQNMFSLIQPMPMQETNYQVPSTSYTPNSKPRRNLENEICNLAIEPVTKVWDNHVLMEHLIDIKQVTRRIVILAIERKHGLIDPTQGDPYFQCNVYDLGWSLKWWQDFLSREWPNVNSYRLSWHMLHTFLSMKVIHVTRVT